MRRWLVGIVERWSPSALRYIKQRAWKLAQAHPHFGPEAET